MDLSIEQIAGILFIADVIMCFLIFYQTGNYKNKLVFWSFFYTPAAGILLAVSLNNVAPGNLVFVILMVSIIFPARALFEKHPLLAPIYVILLTGLSAALFYDDLSSLFISTIIPGLSAVVNIILLTVFLLLLIYGCLFLFAFLGVITVNAINNYKERRRMRKMMRR